MNVYDFDDTIYRGDSSVDFYIFCLRKNIKLLKYLPKQIKAVILYKLKKIDKNKMKEIYFSFLNDIDAKNCVKEFWNKKNKNIKKWYMESKKEDDVVISASPEFLLKPICEEIGIKNLIATKVDMKTGKFIGDNCKGEKKVELFREKFKEAKIDKFYSDSYSDTPLAKISEEAYIVKGNRISEWGEKKDIIFYLNNLYSNLLFVVSTLVFVYAAVNAETETAKIFRYSAPKCIAVAGIMAIIYATIKPSFFKTFMKKSIFNKILSILATIGTAIFYVGQLELLGDLYILDIFHINLSGDLNKVNLFYNLVGFMMAPFCLVLFSKIYSYIYKVFKKLFDKITIKEVIVLIASFALLSTFGITMVKKCSLLYDYRHPFYDVVYTSDSLHLLVNNCWMNIVHAENDIRQPLFAMFSAPFIAPMHIITSMYEKTDVMELTIEVVLESTLVIVLTAFMLSKMLNKNKSNIPFMILFLSTFAPLMFAFTVEQYAIGVFWLVVCVYMYVNEIKDRALAFIAAVGTLTTTGIAFPIIWNKEDNLLSKIKKLINTFVYGMFIMLLFGRLEIFVKLKVLILKMIGFTSGDKVTFLDKIKQYLFFITNCFVGSHSSGTDTGWELNKITWISLIGIVILILSIISYFINKKNKTTRVSFYWVIFSILLFVGLGWGTGENGLVLYTLYFSWAFIILLYQLVEVIFKKLKIEKYLNYATLCTAVVLLVVNLKYLMNIVNYLITIVK